MHIAVLARWHDQRMLLLPSQRSAARVCCIRVHLCGGGPDGGRLRGGFQPVHLAAGQPAHRQHAELYPSVLGNCPGSNVPIWKSALERLLGMRARRHARRLFATIMQTHKAVKDVASTDCVVRMFCARYQPHQNHATAPEQPQHAGRSRTRHGLVGACAAPRHGGDVWRELGRRRPRERPSPLAQRGQERALAQAAPVQAARHALQSLLRGNQRNCCAIGLLHPQRCVLACAVDT